MKSKVLAAAIFLCMLLTACGVKTALEGNTSATSSTSLTSGDNAENDLLSTDTNDLYDSDAATTPIELHTTALPAVTAQPKPIMTQIPETSLEPITTAAPISTAAPETSPVATTTATPTTTPSFNTNDALTTTAAPITAPDVPVTTTAAPVTTAEPILDKVPRASDVVGQVPASPAADPSWFDDACFIGDSVTEGLKTYCLSGKLGKAKFFAVRSYSTLNALRSLSAGGPHPSYQGVKMLSEDCVQKSGSKKVFIMLGINEMYYGVDPAVKRYKQLIDRILEKSPDAQIFVQSVTPMTSTSTYIGDMLNNTNIRRFNEKMKQACEENGWYYLDIASAVVDSTGIYLNRDICSDKNSMGIHFNTKGYKLWVEYLLKHTVDFTPPEPEIPVPETTDEAASLPSETTADASANEPAEPSDEPSGESALTTAVPAQTTETPASDQTDAPESTNKEQS